MNRLTSGYRNYRLAGRVSENLNGTIIFISHDRSFYSHMATRIVDLDRGKLVTYPGNYDHLLELASAARRRITKRGI